jgi:protein SCO1/2
MRRKTCLFSWVQVLLGALLLAAFAGCEPHAAPTWDLTNIADHLPDLEFTLTADNGATTTARAFRGKIVLLFFGYAHCPDVCPLTLSRLSTVLKRLGPEARNVRIVFVSVDPYRDTPQLLQTYVHAFSPQAEGLTGTPAQIAAIAKRYRVAYQAERPDAGGNYAVMHSKAVYVFDQSGHVRLMATDTDGPDAMVHDLKQLLALFPSKPNS